MHIRPILVLQFSYNPAGQLLTLTDGKDQTIHWNYDAEGRLTNKVDAAGAEMFRYGYDPEGRLTNRWQAGGITTSYRYDALGNLTNVVYPASSNLVLGYDALNRLTTLVDGVGTTAFGWTRGNQLASEDGPWANDTVSYGYADRLRGSLTLAQPNASDWTQGYGYDEFWRLTNVTSGAGVFGVQYPEVKATWYVPGLGWDYHDAVPDRVSEVDLPGGAHIDNGQDYLGRLTLTALQDAGEDTLNSHQYAYDEGNQRTQQVFTAGNYLNYTYDAIGQLKTARGYEADGTARLQEQMGYGYDAAWNLNYRTNNGLVQTFNVNSLNELSGGSRSGTLTVAGAVSVAPTSVTVNGSGATVYGDNTFVKDGVSVSDGANTITAIAQDSYGRQDTNVVTAYLPATPVYQYDLRGNLTNDGQRVFCYDDENQLTAVLVSNAWKSEFKYDGLMRRRIRKEYTWLSAIGNWQLTNEVRYVYDGRVVVQERDANNLPLVTYTRGNDLSGSLQGAGGIGGLLARTDNGLLAIGDSRASAFYHCDGNGNVTRLIYSNQLVAARYSYDPFGNTLAATGPLAEANLYRFSSKEWHPNSGLIYYLYRFYDPNLQRWVNRDPLAGC